MESPVTKRSVTFAGRKTSISLEDAFWRALNEIASTHRLKRTELLASIDSARTGNLSSAIRLFVLNYYRDMISAPASSRSRHERNESISAGAPT